MHPHRSGTKSDESGSSIMTLVASGVGLAVFVALHVFFVMTWERLFAWDSVHEAWWLNSGRSVECTVGTLFVVAIAVLYPSDKPARGAAGMWSGVLVGMIAVKIATYHTDDMWPISLSVGLVLTAMPVLFGLLVVAGLKDILKT